MKSLVLASMMAAGALAASSVLAYNPAGTTTTGSGPTTLMYLGSAFPCHGHFTVNVPSAGSPTATITGPASGAFTTAPGDSTVCPYITLGTLPWAIGAASPVSGSPGIYTAPITGITVTIPGVVTCKGSATFTLNNNTQMASFTGTLYDTSSRPCTVSGSGLSTVITAP